MTIESEIAGLTQATTNLLQAVTVSKSLLDSKVSEAAAQADLAATNGSAQVALAKQQADLATTNGAAQVELATIQANNAMTQAGIATVKAGEASANAASTLAIYGNTAAMQTAVAQAAAQASLAAGHAASAASVVQQDLSGVSAAALHRSPNAVTAMFVYDTSKDSDGGAWTEKCQHTSWYNETLNGKWLGAQASEAAARAVAGATTGDYFQRTTDGKFYKLNSTSGITEVFRGNKAKFPRLSAIVAEASNVTIYDLTEPGRPMWMRFVYLGSSGELLGQFFPRQGVPSIYCLNGLVSFSSNDNTNSNTGLCIAYFAGDKLLQYKAGGTASSTQSRSRVLSGGISARNQGTNTTSEFLPAIVSNYVNAVAMKVLPDAPVDPATGLQVPTIAVGTGAGVSVIKHNGAVATNSGGGNYTSVAIVGATLFGRINQSAGTWFYAPVSLGALASGFTMQGMGGQFSAEWGTIKPSGQNVQASVGGGNRINTMRLNRADAKKSAVLSITNTYNTGYMAGEILRAYLADVDVGSVSNPSTVSDRCYKTGSATVNGTLIRSAVASAAQLVAYSGFSAVNYLREPYSADLDFSTGEWSSSAWVSILTANAAAGTIASRAHSSGAYIALGMDATNKLTATVSDGTTTRTVTSTDSYNTGTWLKVRANYTTDGSLALLVNGVEVAVTRGAPLLTLNNANAVLTIGNSYALDAPFPGSIALLKFSATVPTPEQSVWMYEQEKQLFRDGAQCCLPDSGAIVDLAYDDATDKWIAVSATNESEWSGLVRTSVKAVPAGSFSKVAATSGVKLEARTTSSPGVDITIPAYGLREELVKRAESAARLARNLTTFDYVGGFTANTTNGSTSITNVAGLSYPTGYIGAQVTGAGIPAGTVITAVSGTTAYLSKAATATGTAVQISFTDFILPVGYEAKAVMSSGALKQEGSTKDYTRLFDGFKETLRFGAAPGYTAWVQVQAVRSAA